MDVLERKPKTWKISFDIKFNGTVPVWSNVLHFTIGQNRGAFGDRTPAVFVLKNTTRLYICGSYKTAPNRCASTETDLEIGTFHHVEIEEKYISPSFHVYASKVNGNIIHSWPSNVARCFKAVKVYAGNPWYKPANAVIQNLTYQGGSGDLVTYC